MSATQPRVQKREHDGRYAFDGDLERLCVCRHSLAIHSAGSPADCLAYSFPDGSEELQGQQEPFDCGCKRFRLSRRKVRDTTQTNNEPLDSRTKRLARNEVIRQRNKAKAAENEHKPRKPMTTIVMNPRGDKR